MQAADRTVIEKAVQSDVHVKAFQAEIETVKGSLTEAMNKDLLSDAARGGSWNPVGVGGNPVPS